MMNKITIYVFMIIGIGTALSTTTQCQQIFWLQSTLTNPLIGRANSNGSSPVTQPLPSGTLPQGLNIDATHYKLYSAENKYSGAHVEFINSDFTGRDTTHVPPRTSFRGIAVDAANGKMYWTSTYLPEGNMIHQANLDGTGEIILVSFPPGGPQALRGIALDVPRGKMYWTDFGTGKIQRSNLDGSAQEDILAGLNGPWGIVIDDVAGGIYWTEANSGVIKHSNLTGGSPSMLVSALNYPQDITIDKKNGKMYWTELGLGSGRIQKANLDGTVVTDLGIGSIINPQGIIVPSINCPSDIVVNTGCPSLVSFPVSAAGNSIVECKIGNTVITSPYNFPCGSTVVVCTVPGSLDNLNCSFTVTVNSPPVVTLNPKDTSQCAGNTVSFTAAATGIPAPTVQWQVSTDNGATYTDIPGATNTTFSFIAAISQNGNKYRAVFTNAAASVNSTAATLTLGASPAITTQPNSQSICAGGTITFISAATGTPSPSAQWQVSTDNGTSWNNISGATNVTLSFITSSVDNGKQYRVVFTNLCGTSTSDAATLTVNVPPAITLNPLNQSNVCINSTVTLIAGGSGTPIPTIQWQVSTNNGTSWNDISGAVAASYSFTFALTDDFKQYRAVFTNTCGSTNTSAALVRKDLVQPTITAPSNVVYSTDPNQCSRAAANVVLGNPTVSDNCPGVSYSNNAPSSYPKGVTNVTWTAIDLAGNSSTAIQTVTINDTQNPSITAPANIVAGTDPGQCSRAASNVTLGVPTVSDNCPGVTFSNNAPSSFPKGVTNVIWTALDVSGNTATATQTVTINDNENPVITCPANISRNTDANQCGALVSFSAAATDNCPGTTLTYAIGATTITSPYTFPKGVTTVSATATDASNNNASCSFTVTVIDSVPPIIIPPSNITASTDPGLCSRSALNVNLGTPTVSDNCVGVTYSNNAPSVYPKGITNVIWTAVDASGNTATASQTVTINDTQIPVITCPANIVKSTDPNLCSALTSFAAAATDNCPGVAVTYKIGTLPITSPYSFAKGLTTVIATATDASGNSASCSFTVTVNDVQPPTISCPNNITRGTDPNLCSALVSFVAAATDNCPGVTVAYKIGSTPVTSPYTFPKGVTTVTATATDAAANTSSCNFTVTVNDVQPPVITCPANITIESDATCNGATVTYPAPVITDNCPGSYLFSNSNPSGSYFPIGNTTVTLVAKDASGNTASCSFNVTVVMRVRIAPTADQISFGVGCKSAAMITKTITINNSGGHFNGGVLNWNASTSASELTLIPTSGIEGNNLIIRLYPAGLAFGTYTRTITITGQNSVTGAPACNSPYTINVSIKVEPDLQVTQTKSLTTGTWVQFTNSVNQVIAEVKSNNQSVSSFTLNMFPCRYPNGMTRLRYVKKYYTFSTNVPNKNFDIRLYYSNAELETVTRPDLLTIRQQPVTGGSWIDLGGTSDVNANTVTASAVTSTSGVFAMATPWTPKLLTFNLITALYDRTTKHSVIQWTSPLITNADGFYIERIDQTTNVEGQGAWEPVGNVVFNPSGEYGFSEKLLSGIYSYRIYAFDRDGNGFESDPFTINATSLPMNYSLDQNYPNPFGRATYGNPSTEIRFTLAENSHARLAVYDMFMRKIMTLVDEERSAGTYTVRFDASQLPSGTYFYKLEAGSYSQTRKMNLMK